MAMVEWRVQGREFANCNCAYGCPCQFNALPTYGCCEAINGFQIDKGNFGDVSLDGLRAIALYKWPGPVHLGNGTMQLIIDERADARQRDALISGFITRCARTNSSRFSSPYGWKWTSRRGRRSWWWRA